MVSGSMQPRNKRNTRKKAHKTDQKEKRPDVEPLFYSSRIEYQTAESFLSLQHAQQHVFESPAAASCLTSVIAASFASPSFFNGHESPEQQQHEAFSLPAASFFFIGHASPLQQQSSLSQHDAFASGEASLFFIGHESPEQQQHDIAAVFVTLVCV